MVGRYVGNLRRVHFYSTAHGIYSYNVLLVFLVVGHSSNRKTLHWPAREDFFLGKHTVKKVPFVNPRKVLLPSLHIKLWLMKDFVKALHVSGGFLYLQSMFLNIIDLSANKLEKIRLKRILKVNGNPLNRLSLVIIRVYM
jgi:hypothetical protein